MKPFVLLGCALLPLTQSASASVFLYGDPAGTGNCGNPVNCASPYGYNAPGTTGLTVAGDFYEPLAPSLSNFTIYGAFTNAAEIQSAGWFDNAGFNIGGAGTLTNAASGTVHEYHGTNDGVLLNRGTWRSNYFVPSGSVYGGSLIQSGAALGGLNNNGAIDNAGLFSNFGNLENVGTFTNYSMSDTGTSAYGILQSSWNSDITHISAFDGIGPFPVRIENAATGHMENRGTLINGNAADAALDIHTSTLINAGSFVNRGGTHALQEGWIQNYDTIRNHASFTSTSAGAQIPSSDSARIDNYGTIENRDPTTGLAQAVWSNGLRSALNNYGYITNGTNGLLANESQGTLRNEGLLTNTAIVQNDGLLVNSAQSSGGLFTAGEIINTGTLENGSGGVLFNQSNIFNDGEIINRGEFTVDASGRVDFSTGSGIYRQVAGKTRVDGLIDQAAIYLEGGIFSGSGTVTFVASEGTLEQSGGTLAPGDPVTLTIDGNYHMSGGMLEIQIASLDDLDHVVVTGNAQLDAGTIQFDFLNGYAPSAGDVFEFILAQNFSINADLLTYVFTGLQPGFRMSVSGGDNGLQMTALNDGVASPVPLAGTFAFFATALGTAAGISRKRA